MSSTTIDRYLVIAGHGRSGSNRLLDAFDCHPAVFCRNEPNKPSGSPFLKLPDGFFPSQRADFADLWKPTIDQAARQISVRDRLRGVGKDFVRSPIRRAYARHVFLRARPRKAAALFAPSLRSQTSPAEPHYAEPGLVSLAYPVFKILLTPGWLIDAFDGDPRMRVILNLRAPAGFLRSWRHRYAEAAGVEEVFRANLNSLPRILQHFGAEGLAPHGFSEAALYESELWRWRYVNEIMLQRLKDSARFTAVTYEAFDSDPVGQSERLYAFAGVEMTAGVRDKIRLLENRLFKPRTNTRFRDEPLVAAAIDKVLEGSPLNAFWP